MKKQLGLLKNSKRKTIVLSAVILIIATLTTAFAFSLHINNGKTSGNNPMDIKVSEEQAIEFIDELVSEKGIDKEQIPLTDYSDIEGYLYLIEKYKPNSEELDIVNNLIKNDISMDIILEVFDFYRTTNENPDIINKLVSYKDILNGRHWVENAFNSITKDKCGVLDYDTYMEYIDKGLSMEEISASNILCRKGVYTIQEILKKRENETLWSDIINDVYSKIGEDKIFINPKTDSDDDGLKLLDLKRTSEIYGVSIEELEKMDEIELSEFKEQQENIYTENVQTKLKNIGIDSENIESEVTNK